MGIQPVIIDRASRIYILFVSIIQTHFLLGLDYLCKSVSASLVEKGGWDFEIQGHMIRMFGSKWFTLSPYLFPHTLPLYQTLIRLYDYSISLWLCSRWTGNPGRNRANSREIIGASTRTQVMSETWGERRVSWMRVTGAPGTRAGFPRTTSDQLGCHTGNRQPGQHGSY